MTHRSNHIPMERSFDLLVVDDDESQVSLLRTLISDMGLSHRCHHCHNGQEALEYLHRKSRFENEPRPHLILLDVNMPGMNGCEVLSLIKLDPLSRSIPVVMLSSSQSSEEINNCYLAHANAYIRKPIDLAANESMVRNLDRFWKDCELALG